ncbi:predicted protein [Botrytis cinerea T4]|uniref:Uncharacterized protein n=1 Tax=Botryotinia fuckeliana (strain T4) TaxID=999810 RepID=G2Y964_BOTF4|nr:predicted protein [Botrytis cinerea T4]
MTRIEWTDIFLNNRVIQEIETSLLRYTTFTAIDYVEV